MTTLDFLTAYIPALAIPTWYPNGWIHKSIDKMHQRHLQQQTLDSLKYEVYKLDARITE